MTTNNAPKAPEELTLTEAELEALTAPTVTEFAPPADVHAGDLAILDGPTADEPTSEEADAGQIAADALIARGPPKTHSEKLAASNEDALWAKAMSRNPRLKRPSA